MTEPQPGTVDKVLEGEGRAVSGSSTEGIRQIDGFTNLAGWVTAGGILGAFGASSCCILPLVLFSLGAGGAWLGNLTALAPYQPIFIAVTLASLTYGFYAVYWKPKRACADGGVCAAPLSGRVAKTALWVATLLIAAAIAFPYVAPRLLGIQ